MTKFPDHIQVIFDSSGDLRIGTALRDGDMQAEYVLNRVQVVKIERKLEDVEF